MAWFNVDDGYWSHPKVMFLPLDARGLWVTSGSWCSQHLTDGRIPKRVLETIAPARRGRITAMAAEMIDAGLWADDGDEWLFLDWADWQRTRAQVEEDRAKSAQRVAKFREKQRSNAVGNGAQSNPIQSNRERAPQRARSLNTKPTPSPPPIAEVLAEIRNLHTNTKDPDDE